MTAAVCLRCTVSQECCIACCGLPKLLMFPLWPAKSSYGPVEALQLSQVCAVLTAHAPCVPAGVLIGKQTVSGQPHPEHSRQPVHLPC